MISGSYKRFSIHDITRIIRRLVSECHRLGGAAVPSLTFGAGRYLMGSMEAMMEYYVNEYGRYYPDRRYVDLHKSKTAARQAMRTEAKEAARSARARFGRAWVQPVGPDMRIIRCGSRAAGTNGHFWTSLRICEW